MSHQQRKPDREAFLLPSGCGDLVDALRLKRQQAERRSEARHLSRMRIAEAFARWNSWAERYVQANSADVRDPELRRFLDIAALLTRREKTQVEKRIAEHPLASKTHQRLIRSLLE